LAKALGCIKIPPNPNVLAGVSDDAGVYKLTDDLAIVETVDLIAAVADDPYIFGSVAAANGISDIYAKGGRPITAMNIVAFPSDTMDTAILGQILKGALDKLNEAGVALVGGHSVRNDEVRFGVAVTGIIHPDKIIFKNGAKAGDQLILTKPLGTGILNTTLKAGMLPDAVRDRASAQMTALNDKASRAMVNVGAHACTDVTGFGLLGHLAEVGETSGLSAEIDSKSVPIIPEALEFAHMGLIPEGMYANWEFRAPMVDAGSIDEDTMAVLYDPQTSGGLLIVVPPEKTEAMMSELKKFGVAASLIGRMTEGQPTRVKVL
jgi:selenide,water dikinase